VSLIQSLSAQRALAPASAEVGDQAEGLRRLFGTPATCFVPLVGNPHLEHSGVAIERLSAALSLLGRHTLIVDAADFAPPVPEAAALGLASCIECLTPRVSYLAARGLPARFVDTRGSSARLLDELGAAVPRASVVLVHAEAPELARLFSGRAARPVLLAADHPESVKHAYAAWKLLAQRRGWLSSDLLLIARPGSPRVPQIAQTLARCAEGFMNAVLARWAAIDPLCTAHESPDAALCHIATSQLMLLEGEAPCAPGERYAARAVSASAAARH
jgi:flagellar biosynthesis protein FlhG